MHFRLPESAGLFEMDRDGALCDDAPELELLLCCDVTRKATLQNLSQFENLHCNRLGRKALQRVSKYDRSDPHGQGPGRDNSPFADMLADRIRGRWLVFNFHRHNQSSINCELLVDLVAPYSELRVARALGIVDLDEQCSFCDAAITDDERALGCDYDHDDEHFNTNVCEQCCSTEEARRLFSKGWSFELTGYRVASYGGAEKGIDDMTFKAWLQEKAGKWH